MIAIKSKPGFITADVSYNIYLVDDPESEDSNPFKNNYYIDCDDGYCYTICECAVKEFFGALP